MTDDQIIKCATTLAKNRKFAKAYGHIGAELLEPDVFENSFGFFKWCKENKLTKDQKQLYMKTYRENYEQRI